jgi:ABC-type branched-subunit amino acid transport system ATPase component
MRDRIAMNLLEVQNICSGYGPTQILHDISINVEEREIVTIIGPNGCGKSTLLKTIMGFLIPTKGNIFFQNENVSKLRPDIKVSKGLNYVPQLENVFPSLTVRENLDMGGYLLSKSEIEDQINKIFELFPILSERLNQKAGTLSGGQRQMVAMGSALMINPKLILLDEPSAGLAPAATEELFNKIVDINRQGTTIVIIEQNAYESLNISNRGFVIAMGRNEIQDSAENILSNPQIRKAYLGGD